MRARGEMCFHPRALGQAQAMVKVGGKDLWF
jgi:hypothetical protein